MQRAMNPSPAAASTGTGHHRLPVCGSFAFAIEFVTVKFAPLAVVRGLGDVLRVAVIACIFKNFAILVHKHLVAADQDQA